MSETSYRPAIRVLPRSAGGPAWSEMLTMITRALRLTLRNVDALTTAFALPVLLMLMFVYLFGGAIHTGTHYVDYVVPGVILVCISFGASTTAVSVAHDLTGGIIDRFRSMDVRGETLINGHVVASVARNVLSSTLAIAVAVAVGFRPHGNPANWLAAAGILVLFMVALSWLAAAIGTLVRSPEAAQGTAFLIGFLAYPSSAFVPIHTMPPLLQDFASNQPVTAVADAVRALFNGAPVGANAWHAVVWSIAIVIASMTIAGVLFRRRAG
jgi:ABC-2 type transport system permease protein